MLSPDGKWLYECEQHLIMGQLHRKLRPACYSPLKKSKTTTSPDSNNNQQEIIFAQREPAAVKAADIAGSWNLVQFQTPAQITEDINNGLQGNSNFSVTNGTMTINVNGTLSGNLGDAFTGTFTVGSAGVIHASIHSGGGIMPITFYLNAGKDTMTEVDSQVDANDNQQEMVIAHRVPAN